MKFLRSLFSKSEPAPEFKGAVNAEKPIYVIGDIHGCYDQTLKLVADCPKDAQLVFVGDLIDRGPDSAKVMQYVKDKVDAGAICIKGNHEKMLQDFLERPVDCGERWFRYGGLQTLESYGVRGFAGTPDFDTLVRVRNELIAAMPDGMQAWITDLPKHFQTGNVHVVHAGADPAIDMQDQASGTLVWGHRDFFEVDRADGQWVVVGHTILDQPLYSNGRIAIDTGSYATGIVTAAYIKTDQVEFFQARA